MNQWKGKVAVVTGASAGIGLAIAQSLIREGMIVVGLARRKEKMEQEMSGVDGKERFYAVKCDVRSEEDLHRTFQWIKNNVGIVQVMVNNAGLFVSGTILETDRSDWQKVFDVNVMALLECSKAAAMMMKEADVEGYIINISSIEGHVVHLFGDMRFNVYPGTKHAVTGLAKTLQAELRGGKIRITNISPGYVSTEIVAAANVSAKLEPSKALDPQDIADAVIYVLGTAPRVQIQDMIIKPVGEP